MSFIKDVFFGGAEKEAAEQQQRGLEQAQQFVREGMQQARGDIMNLFPASQQAQRQGFQGAMDIFSQALPAQTNVFTQGNLGAQQALLAGLPQFQNALLGGAVNFGALQPVQVRQPDLSFFNQQLPAMQNPFEQVAQPALPPREINIGDLLGGGRGVSRGGGRGFNTSPIMRRNVGFTFER